MTAPRPVDPTPVLVRHVRRPRAGETATATVLRAGFLAAAGAELEALNSEAGWQSGVVAEALNDDGNVSLVFPNATGDDGVLHRRRFALLTDPYYRLGEEWIEVYREPMSPGNLIAVMTPARWRMDRSTLELSGTDVMALYTLARSSELDVWHHAPRDVFDFYTRLPVPDLGRSFAGWNVAAGSLGGTTSDGWTFANVAVQGALPGVVMTSPDIPTPSFMEHDLEDVDSDNFEVSARATGNPSAVVAAVSRSQLELELSDGSTIRMTYKPDPGEVTIGGSAIATRPGVWRAQGHTQRTMPGGCSLRLLVRGRWVYAFLEGELLARARRQSELYPPVHVTYSVHATSTTLNRIDAQSVKPFGLRGADKGDLRLPGAPTPGGLRGRYWSEASAVAAIAAAGGDLDETLEAFFDPLTDPSDSRLDTKIDFAPSTTWQPPAAQNPAGAFSARWTGAIYLDLSGNGRKLRLGASPLELADSALNGSARLWVGRTLRPLDLVIDAWENTGLTKIIVVEAESDNLADVLDGSGWYPIVLDFGNVSGTACLKLYEAALDGDGDPISWSIVPASKLSPLGCYEETHRLESHRELLDAVSQAAGFQWRVEPRTLESGEFPAQVIPRIRAGEDTDKIVHNDHAVELASEGDAADAVDRLLIDAAGIADPNGAEQLTADVLNDATIAAGHLFLSTGSESLPEVTEASLLEQRALSFLALRAGPNEQIAARPTDTAQELTDTFPLTGALARRRWRPGDGLRLALEDLSVIDLTPRQLLAVSWPIYRDGIGVPSVGFRQRPRGLRAFLKRTARTIYAQQRNYQGQSAIVTGSWGANLGPDGHTRAPLPDDLRRVVRAELVVVRLVNGPGTIEVNGVATADTVNAPGRYPLQVERTTPGEPRMYARLTSAAGGFEYEAHLELRVRV